MDTILAAGFLLALSVFLAIVLAIANNKLKVFEDPRIDKVAEMLPGVNCGACGSPGCTAFSEKVVSGEALPGECPVGGAETAAFIASFLGIDVGIIEKTVARLLCAGGSDVALQAAEYEGYASCRSAAVVAGGAKGCTYGCLGLGDCREACTFDAIFMAENDLPVVLQEKCTSCGDCVTICPKGLFEILPLSQHLLVQCKSLLAGEGALEQCRVACTGCGICRADAPNGLIEIKNNLAVIDAAQIDLQTELATLRCPTGSIKWTGKQQFVELRRARSAGRDVGVDT